MRLVGSPKDDRPTWNLGTPGMNAQVGSEFPLGLGGTAETDWAVEVDGINGRRSGTGATWGARLSFSSATIWRRGRGGGEPV